MLTPARTIRPRATSYLLLLLCLLGGTSAFAQAVVLDLRNDTKDRLRSQIEASLKDVKGLEVIDSDTWDARVKKEKLTAARARGGVAVRRLAKDAGVSVAVAGRITGSRFRVQLLDADGKVLSNRTLRLSRGRLKQRDLNRLGNAVLAAVETARPKEAPKPEPKPAPEPEPVVTSSSSSDVEDEAPVVAPTALTPTATVEAPPKVLDDGKVVPAQTFRVTVFGAATWRSACLAPSSTSCVAYKRLEPADQPPGRFVEFSTQIPYSGVGAKLEWFPFGAGGRSYEGLGILVSGQRAWVNVNLRQGLSGSTFTQVKAADDLVTAELAWRFGFDLGPVRAWAGPRGGFTWRNFDVEAANEGLLPGSDRRFGTAGVDLGVKISPSVNLELAGNYAILPGQTKATRRRFGLGGDSSGFSGHLGVSGKVTGILGYHVRLNLMGFSDTYEATGVEEEWTAGGVGQEFYTGLELGLSLGF